MKRFDIDHDDRRTDRSPVVSISLIAVGSALRFGKPHCSGDELAEFVVGGGHGHCDDESRDLAGVSGDAGWASGSGQFRRVDC